MRRIVTFLCLSVFCLAFAGGILAQGQASGVISGVVLDPDNKVVVGAVVTVTDVATNAPLQPTKTNNDGRFSLADVPPGTYTISIEMTGFKKSVSKNVTVITGRTYDIPVRMEVGVTSVEVQVDTGGMQVMESQNTSLQATVTGRAITNLPFESRSAVLLGVLDPGAQTIGGARNTSFEGLPQGTINIIFDGINVQDNLLKSGDGFHANNDPRIDDVEEFGITTNANDASKAGEGAVQMSYVSKRGGNAFHGGVWETNRNQDFNSNYYFNNLNGLPRQKTQLNEFGYKVGGPILKNKLFFFTDFDFFQFPQSLAVSSNILNQAAANGMFTYAVTGSGVGATVPANGTVSCTNTASGKVTASSICTANLLPTTVGGTNSIAFQNGFVQPIYNNENSIVQSLQTAVETVRTAPGVAIGAPASRFQDTIAYNANTMNATRYPDIRLDFNATKNDSIEFDYHYSWFNSAPDVLNNQQATFPVAPFNASAGSQLSNRSLFVLAWRRAIGTNMSNQLRLGIQSAPINFGLGETTSIFPKISTNFGNNLPASIGIFGDSRLFHGSGNTQGRNTALGQIHDTFSWTKGTHQFQFGFDETDIRHNDFNDSPNAGALTFGIDSQDPVAAIFTAGTPTIAGNFPGISSTQLGNAEGLYASLLGDITSYTNSVAFNPKTRQFQTALAITDNLGQLELGFFGGDSWRVRPSLTFNYGLRWEYEGPPSDRNNQFFMNKFNSVWGVSGPGNLFSPGALGGSQGDILYTNDLGKSWYNKYYRALAPSVGVAWQPASDHALLKNLLGGPGKTVLRAGFSISYSREGINNVLGGIAQGNPGFTASQSASADAAAGNSAALGTFVPGTQFLGSAGGLQFVNQNPTSFISQFPLQPQLSNSVNVVDPNIKPPMIESWNAGIQRELTSNMVLEIRYQANHGVGLWDQFDLNETNIFENGFLREFQNAQTNMGICEANAVACLSAQTTAGVAHPNVTSFGDFGLAGQINLPIITGLFTGSQSGSQASSLFHNATLVDQLLNNGAGSFASILGGEGGGAINFNGNLTAAGFPSNFFIVNPQATGGAFVLTNGAQSTYNALVIDLRHRPSHGLQFDVNYSFAKSLTDLQSSNSINFNGFTTLRNPELNKGPAPFDIRHALKAQAIYELPFGPGHRLTTSNGVVNRFIGGWEVNTITRFQTGQSVLVTSGVNDGNTFNNNDPGITIGGGQTVKSIQGMLTTNKTQIPLAVGWVPNALLAPDGTANPAVFQPCNVAGALCGFPYFHGPSFFRSDISLVKTTKITERVNLELRLEALNAFNDADFYWACGVSTSPCSVSTQSNTFSQMGGAYQDINTTQDPGGRILQLIARVNF